ncbi:MAG: aminoacyl-tRNA hydrolase [Lachnospiraceae bacterium]|nr:aminoacyl-tRNA hydrolase [Lachnospiraceae bacterium]
MIIIAGLGNPGRQYENTRHNCGFKALDILADRHNITVSSDKFRALTGSGFIGGKKVLLMKPQTFMNLSGESIRAACQFYQVDVESELIVMYDDISLDPGQLRVRAKGSAGGHNGMKNIIAQLGTDKFPRIKIGVGAKPVGMDLADYVLGRFPLSEGADMIDAFDRAARAAQEIVEGDIAEVMNRYNRKD